VKEAFIKAIPEILTVLSPLFAVIATWLSVQAGRLINANIKSTNYRAAAFALADNATTAVKALAQTTVAELKDPTKDGVFTADEAERIKQEAIATVLARLPDVKKIAKDLGVAEAGRLRERIADEIEAAVLDVKASTPATEPRAVNTNVMTVQ
jgi:predicted Zn-dependent peptidase